MVCFGVLAEVVWGRKVARKGGGDKPPATESSCPTRVPRGWLLWEQPVCYGEARRRGSRA